MTKTKDSHEVRLHLPKDVFGILSKQAANMQMSLEEFLAGLIDLGYAKLAEDGGAKAYR